MSKKKINKKDDISQQETETQGTETQASEIETQVTETQVTETETQAAETETQVTETQIPEVAGVLPQEDKQKKIKTNTRPRQRKVIGHEARTNRWGYAFVAPFVVAFLIFNLWPTINTFLISFTDLRGLRNDYVFKNARCPVCLGSGESYLIDGQGNDILDANGDPILAVCDTCHGTGRITPVKYNYTKLIKDPYFWGALGNTFIIWGFNFIPQLGIALVLAIWLSDTRLNLAGKGLFRAVVYMPNLLTAASIALLYRSLFGYPISPANQFLQYFGFYDTFISNTGEVFKQGFNFFRSVPFSRGLTAFIQWWMWYGHTLIMLMAGITSIPISLYESATVDGANSRQTAFYITLPLLRPMMLYILITSMIGGMQMFDIPFLLTNGMGAPDFKIRTTVVYQYDVAFFMGAGDKAYGSTISVGIFVVTVILAMIIFFLLQDRSDLSKKKGGVK